MERPSGVPTHPLSFALAAGVEPPPGSASTGLTSHPDAYAAVTLAASAAAHSSVQPPSRSSMAPLPANAAAAAYAALGATLGVAPPLAELHPVLGSAAGLSLGVGPYSVDLRAVLSGRPSLAGSLRGDLAVGGAPTMSVLGPSSTRQLLLNNIKVPLRASLPLLPLYGLTSSLSPPSASLLVTTIAAI